MKLIAKNTDYAVRAISHIARNKGKIISVTNLVEELKMPGPFLRKILQVLNKKRILKSYKGQGGGFLLAMPANKIFLVDLIVALQGPLILNSCIFKKTICPDKNICVLKKKIDDIERNVIAELRSITVASLLKGESKRH